MHNKILFLLYGLIIAKHCQAKGQQHKVQCLENEMKIIVPLPDNNAKVYLEGLNGYRNEKCEPKIIDNIAVFELSLVNFYDCGLIRVVNKLSDIKIFYHKIIIDTETSRELINVKCKIQQKSLNHTSLKVKRDVLPAGFEEEPVELDIPTELTGKAPDPVLGIGVRQGSNLISENLNVGPGTPLQMEIFLDRNSSTVYGLGVNFMQVSDTRNQEETIIFNGCSVDPYLFENFVTETGDFLTAKFRAFKFPDTSYVQFRGTVNVCLDKCKGVECSNGQIGYGKRKKRDIPNSEMNKLFEIDLSTFIRVDFEGKPDQKTVAEVEKNINNLKMANKKLNRSVNNEKVFEGIHDRVHDIKPENLNSEVAKVEETSVFTKMIENFETSGSQKNTQNALITLLLITIIRFI